jgi:hypothetical protein
LFPIGNASAPTITDDAERCVQAHATSARHDESVARDASLIPATAGIINPRGIERLIDGQATNAGAGASTVIAAYGVATMP